MFFIANKDFDQFFRNLLYEYNRELLEYCVIQKDAKENHFEGYLEHSVRVLEAKRDEIDFHNLREHFQEFVKETLNDFVDRKTPKH